MNPSATCVSNRHVLRSPDATHRSVLREEEKSSLLPSSLLGERVKNPEVSEAKTRLEAWRLEEEATFLQLSSWKVWRNWDEFVDKAGLSNWEPNPN